MEMFMFYLGQSKRKPEQASINFFYKVIKLNAPVKELCKINQPKIQSTGHNDNKKCVYLIAS